jgi:Domain of unknown function (DUF4262)
MDSPQDDKFIDDDQLIHNIENYGWTVMLIEATEYLPSFAYTVGLWKNYNHPELISFGLTTKTLHSILNTGAELVTGGQYLQVGRDYDDFFENGISQFIQVDPGNLKDYFGYAISFNNTNDFPALQLVWTDRNNKFPWDKGFEEEFIFRQPLLDRNADFKFREDRRLAVFTTRQWIEKKKPILRVVHDEDGDWQFLTGEQMPEDINIVALEQMTLRDPTLNDIFNLDYGEAVERNFIGDKWIRSSVESDE